MAFSPSFIYLFSFSNQSAKETENFIHTCVYVFAQLMVTCQKLDIYLFIYSKKWVCKIKLNLPKKKKKIHRSLVCVYQHVLCVGVCVHFGVPCSAVLLGSIWSLWVLHRATGTLPLLQLIAWHLTSAMLHCSIGEDRRIERDECAYVCIYLAGKCEQTTEKEGGESILLLYQL